MDQRCIVELQLICGGLVGCARHVSAVHGLAQCSVVCKLHHRKITRHLQAELVARLPQCLRCQQCRLTHVCGHTVQLVGTSVVGKAVGGVQGVLAELLAQFGLALLDGGEAFAGGSGQLCTAENKVAQCVLVCLVLLASQPRRVDSLVFCIQLVVCAQTREELGDFGQCLVVSRAQLGCVGHAVEVAHRPPGATQLLRGYVQYRGDAVPVCGEIRSSNRLQRCVALREQLLQRGRNMAGLDLVKQRQVSGYKQWVHGLISCYVAVH